MATCHFLHLTANRPGAIAIIQLIGDVEPVLETLTGQSEWPIGRMRLVNFDDIDEGLAGCLFPGVAQLMPHGGVRVVQKIITRLFEAGIEMTEVASSDPCETYPEAADRIEALMLQTLARAQSPLAIELPATPRA